MEEKRSGKESNLSILLAINPVQQLPLEILYVVYAN